MNSNIMKRVIDRDFSVRDKSGNLTWITPVFESSPVLKIVQFDKLWSSNLVSANDLSLTLTCEWQSLALFLSTSQNCRPKQMKVAHSKEGSPIHQDGMCEPFENRAYMGPCALCDWNKSKRVLKPPLGEIINLMLLQCAMTRADDNCCNSCI